MNTSLRIELGEAKGRRKFSVVLTKPKKIIKPVSIVTSSTMTVTTKRTTTPDNL